MQRVRVSPRLEAGGWGVQRHSARQVDRGGRGAEGGDQAARGEVGREQWGVEGSSGKQGKRLLIFPPSDLFLSCRLFFPITLAFQRENTLLKFRDKHWLISCFLYGGENGESYCVLKPGEAGGRHQGEEEQPPDRPTEVHEHASNVAVQHCCHQVLLAIATRLLSGASC